MKSFTATHKALLGGAALVAFGIAAVLSVGSTPNAPLAGDVKAGPSDHTMFGGNLDRNMVNKIDTGIPDKIELDGQMVLWKAQLGSRAYGGPLVSGGKIIIGTNNEFPRNKRDTVKLKNGDVEPIDRGVVMCFDEKTGKFLWQAVHDKLISGQVNDWPREGVCSTPVVEGERVYYVSNRCTVVCADANGRLNGVQGKALQFTDPVTKQKKPEYADPTDADILWEYDMIGELNVFPHNMAACSPLIAGDMLFVVTANGVDENHINIPSPEAPSFIALDKKTGKLLWKRSDPGKNIMHGQWSNPVYAQINGVPQVIFPGGDGWLYSYVPATGELIWKFDCNPKDAVYELGGTGTKSDFIGTPVVYDNKVYVGVGQDPEHSTGIANFFCVAPKKDSKGDISKTIIDRLEKPGKPINERPNPNSCEVWRYGGAETAQWAPRDFKFGRTMSTACIVDDIVYISELTGFLHCLDAKTGKHYWLYDMKTSVWGSPYYVDGKILIAGDHGDLFIFRHDKKQQVFDEVEAAKDAPDLKTARMIQKKVQKEIEKTYLLSKTEFNIAIRSTPVVANGVLYIMTETTLFALKCGK